MKRHEEKEWEATLHRLLNELEPVPAPPTLLPRILSALPQAASHPARGWSAWPWTVRAAVFLVLASLAGLCGWLGTVCLWEPAREAVAAAGKPAWALWRAAGAVAQGLAEQWLPTTAAPRFLLMCVLFLAGTAAAMVAAGYVRLLQLVSAQIRPGEPHS